MLQSVCVHLCERLCHLKSGWYLNITLFKWTLRDRWGMGWRSQVKVIYQALWKQVYPQGL